MTQQQREDYVKAIVQTVHERDVKDMAQARLREATAQGVRTRFDRALAEWRRLTTGGQPK